MTFANHELSKELVRFLATCGKDERSMEILWRVCQPSIRFGFTPSSSKGQGIRKMPEMYLISGITVQSPKEHLRLGELGRALPITVPTNYEDATIVVREERYGVLPDGPDVLHGLHDVT